MRKMNIAGLCLPLLILPLVCACGGEKKELAQGDSSKTSQQPASEEKSLPPGYPAELTLPPGYKPSNLKTGSGTISGGGQGERAYKSYELWKMFPKDAPAIVAHYRKLLTGQNYKGEWKGDGKTSAYGQFSSGKHQVNLSINEEKFSFKLKVFE